MGWLRGFNTDAGGIGADDPSAVVDRRFPAGHFWIWDEPGAQQVAEALLDRGVGVEAGIWTGDAATVVADGGLAERCIRILIEPMEQDLGDALATVRDIENRLDGVAPGVPRLLHGFEMTVWPVIDHAAARGHDTRVGLEDTLRRPDGATAHDNADLIRAAASRLHPEAPM